MRLKKERNLKRPTLRRHQLLQPDSEEILELAVVGLGNPGEKYSRTRHNVGFWVVDLICSELNIRMKKPWFSPFLYGNGEYQGFSLHLAKPLTYMNRSGDAIGGILKKSDTGIHGLLVVCDSMDIPAGTLRLRKKGSSAGHNGLKSLIAALGGESFMRLSVGIGRPGPDSDVISHVLGIPAPEEAELLERAVKKAARAIPELLLKAPESVMNEINRN